MRAVLAVRSCCSPSAHCSSLIILCLKFFFQLPTNWRVIPIRCKLWTLAARVVPAETLGSAPTESTADDMAALRRAANNASANEHVGFDHITFFYRAEQISWHLPSRASPPSTNTKTHPLSHNCCPMLIYVVAHPSCVCARMFLHNRSYRQTRMRLAQLVCFSFNLSIFHYYIGVEMFKYMFYLMYTRAATLKPI